MAITFRQGEGSRTTNRTIAGIAAGVLSVNTGNLATPQVGDIVEIFGSSTTANNGFYTITAIDAGPNPDTYTLRPTPVDQGASGTAARLNRATARTLSASAVTSVLAIGENLAVLEVAGANFITNDIQRNDRVPLSGSSIAANNGAWYVSEILSETRLVVRAPDGGTGMTTEGAGTGTISARHGIHRLAIVDEAVLGWQTILDNAVPLVGPSGGSPNFGSGLARDYVRRVSSGGDATSSKDLFLIQGVSFIGLDQAGLGVDSQWTSENEIVVEGRDASPGSGGDISALQFQGLTSGWGSILAFTLGTHPGDRYSADFGSVWIGVRFTGNLFTGTQRVRFNAYGSYVDLGGALFSDLGGDGQAVASIFRPAVIVRANHLAESIITYGSAGFAAFGSGDSDNVLDAQKIGAAALSVAGTVGGWLDADGLSIFFNTSGGLVVFLDPRRDFDVDTVITNLVENSVSEKHYTFNPRFVARAFGTPAPIVGLSVRIFEINETLLTESLVFSGVTDSNGFLAAGVGVALRRQTLNASNVLTSFLHRFEITGAGFEFINRMGQMRNRIQRTDLDVRKFLADFEGEMSR